MARSICQHCQRPINACICHFIHEIDNKVSVLVLQHPKEVNHTKGSLPLLANSLKNCQVLVGESFDNDEVFYSILKQHAGRCAVLYPSDDAIELTLEHLDVDTSTNNNEQRISCLIVLDATWKKAFKMYQLSSSLKKLPHLKLPQGIKSLYAIRKTQKLDALSTLEASCHALGMLENNTQKYIPLMNEFIKFNEFQLSFRPSNDNR